MDARLTALLAALLLAAAALLACTGGEDEAGPSEATATPTTTATPAPTRTPTTTATSAPTPTTTSTPTPTPTPTSTSTPTSESAEVAADRAVLVAFYRATGGEGWYRNENWLTDEPLGTWYGVTTDSDGRVTELNLTAGTGRSD